VANPSTLWNLTGLAAALVALVVIAVLIARLWRARRAPAPGRIPEPASPQTAEEELDSSHIGFAPLVGNSRPPVDTDAAQRGEDAGKARR
jgi:hypothetical protein